MSVTLVLVLVTLIQLPVNFSHRLQSAVWGRGASHFITAQIIDWWRPVTGTHNITNNTLIYVRSWVNILCLMSWTSHLFWWNHHLQFTQKYKLTMHWLEALLIITIHVNMYTSIWFWIVQHIWKLGQILGVWSNIDSSSVMFWLFCAAFVSIEARKGRRGEGAYRGWCPPAASVTGATLSWASPHTSQCLCLHRMELTARNAERVQQSASVALWHFTTLL